MLKYNKKNQPYEIVSRFRILESDGVVEYCRIKFFNTGYETTFKTSTVNTLDFEDTSLIEEEMGLVEAVVTLNPLTIPEKASTQTYDTSGGVIHTGTIVQDDITSIIGQINATPAVNDGTTKIDLTGAVTFTVVATSPEGEDITVDDLESFVVEHGLDMEAVESCIAGKQKTHKKWKFKTV